MMKRMMAVWAVLAAVLIPGEVHCSEADLEAIQYVEKAELKLQAEAEKLTFASWDFESNITDENQAVQLEAQEKYDLLVKELGEGAKQYDLNTLTDKDAVRKLKLLSDIGTAALSPELLREFNLLKAEMGKVYSTAKVKDFEMKKTNYSLEPELTFAMAESRDPQLLEYYWTQWRNNSGRKIKDMYKRYVELYNTAAELNGFKDASLMKVVGYESDTFIEEMEATWQGLKPLYQQLHAYVRTKLNQFYGDDVVSNEGPLPAHLLGNMWAQSWSNLKNILAPFPDKPSFNVTGEMIRQNWTATKMFEKADDFFQSMGLHPMPKRFWDGSIIEKPADGRELTCHASAWDFYNGKDFRIKQCTRVNQEDFVVVNHEMGHIQYYLQYKHQPHLYRTGANAGFHEGVADVLSLAVGTPTYYQKLGLLEGDVDIEDKETNINLLMSMALDRIAFLPFGYLVDKFRWDVFSGKTSVENMNCHWWKLRHEIQGLKPPSRRSHADFDAGAKYHVASDVGYVRYFTAFIYEFQFYRALCLESGQYVPGDASKPLHRCNFYGSVAAGDKFRELLKLGASRPWKEAMEVITGAREMSSEALREYFSPLEIWLKEENKKNNVKVDWGPLDLDSVCTSTSETSGDQTR